MVFRAVLFGCLYGVCAAGLSWAQDTRSVYLDVSGNNGPATWNNLSFSVSNNTAVLKDAHALSTGVRATVTVSLNGPNTSGAALLSGAAAEFQPAGTNSAYGHQTAWGSMGPLPYGEVVFSNLNPRVAYTFTFFGSRMAVTDNRETRYTVTGAGSGTTLLNVATNASRVATVPDMTPAADGTLTLRVEAGPANSNANGFYHISALKIEYEEPAEKPVSTVFIDAAGTAALPAGWNRVVFNSAAAAVALADTNGTATGISLQITTALNGTNTQGTNNPTGDAAEFKPAGADSCFGHNTVHATPARPQGVARFSGLNTNVAYTFTFYASRMGASDDRSALFTLAGLNSGSNSLNAAGNYAAVAAVSNILPQTNGTITLTVTKGPSNNNSTEYFYIGAIKMSYVGDAVAEPPSAASGKRLLFFGNSFSLGEDVPGHVGSIAAIAGHPAPLVVADLMGGTDLAYHIGQVDAYPANNVTPSALTGTGTWDHVVIQGYSTEATQLRDTSAFRTNALALYRRIKDHASGKGLGVHPVLFQTWARAAGHSYYPGTFASPAVMQHQIRTNYQAAAEIIRAAEPSADVRIAGVGDAFELGGFNAADLYSADLYHAGNIGPELAALILYKTIYGVTVTNIPYAAVRAAGWTSMGSNDWTRVTYWAEGLLPPDLPAATNPPPSRPGFGAREVFLIDTASDGAVAAPPGWNTVSFNAQNSAELVQTNGYETDVTCTVITRMNSLNTGGAADPAGAAAVFTPAGSNNAYGNVNPFGAYSNLYALARFSGLDVKRRYTFMFFASRMGATDNRETLYTVTGATAGTAVLDAANNSSQVALVSDIQPLPDGTVDLRVEPGPNNTSTSLFYHLTAIKVESLRKGFLFLIGP